MVFRAQYAWFIGMILCLLVTLPVAALWALLHESGQQFIDALNDMLEEKSVAILKHRQQVIDLYKNLAKEELI